MFIHESKRYCGDCSVTLRKPLPFLPDCHLTSGQLPAVFQLIPSTRLAHGDMKLLQLTGDLTGDGNYTSGLLSAAHLTDILLMSEGVTI